MLSIGRRLRLACTSGCNRNRIRRWQSKQLARLYRRCAELQLHLQLPQSCRRERMPQLCGRKCPSEPVLHSRPVSSLA